MIIERQNEDIVIRLNASLIDMEEVQKLTSYFRFIESNAQNNGTEEQAAELAREVHSAWWAKNRSRFIK
ncbi:hypothetical protein GCM10007423_58850 [Dyadobacter endophyticus]|uniref:Uncharacterized protein n=1 Tax=Dyadobacter endophyticus TaxID=1749036 RepID=A0ABQ1Z824_9BACT|nr:hypothetical protein [Dyadobacter endophyticus]GGH53410.1 hypothetical protein GCM10007423_58850 [Dyadobacter endophyticus]